MNAQEFLDHFERRNFRVVFMAESLKVEPFKQLTGDDRATVAKAAANTEVRATVERLLRDRQSSAATNSVNPAKAEIAAKLSTADALIVQEIQRKLPGSPLVKIGRPDPGRRPNRAVEVIDHGEQYQDDGLVTAVTPTPATIAHTEPAGDVERESQASLFDRGTQRPETPQPRTSGAKHRKSIDRQHRR